MSLPEHCILLSHSIKDCIIGVGLTSRAKCFSLACSKIVLLIIISWKWWKIFSYVTRSAISWLWVKWPRYESGQLALQPICFQVVGVVVYFVLLTDHKFCAMCFYWSTNYFGTNDSYSIILRQMNNVVYSYTIDDDSVNFPLSLTRSSNAVKLAVWFPSYSFTLFMDQFTLFMDQQKHLFTIVHWIKNYGVMIPAGDNEN